MSCSPPLTPHKPCKSHYKTSILCPVHNTRSGLCNAAGGGREGREGRRCGVGGKRGKGREGREVVWGRREEREGKGRRGMIGVGERGQKGAILM